MVERWFHNTTFGIIGDLTFGEPFGRLKTGGIFDRLKAVTYVTAAQYIPSNWTFMRSLFGAADDRISRGYNQKAPRGRTVVTASHAAYHSPANLKQSERFIDKSALGC
ncbi:hypothetical protein BDW75DRAFT_242607 [Aspergillus navahoensis]